MPGIFDGMRISRSGILATRKQLEVTSNNIANAANEDYTRQKAVVSGLGSIWDGSSFVGQGVEVEKILRIRDLLLDEQLRNTSSASGKFSIKTKWLERIQSIYNEPSDSGINNALSDFWEAWSELAVGPDSIATRSNVLSRANNLADLINDTKGRLDNFLNDLDQAISIELNELNAMTKEFAQLNQEIFILEAGRMAQANDLRDTRDALLDDITEKINVTYSDAKNGMVNLFVGQEPVVYEDSPQKLLSRNDPLDTSKLQLIWEFGDNKVEATAGSIAGLLDIRDIEILAQQKDLDDFATLLLTEVNKVYANGVALDPLTTLESNLGYTAFKVTSQTETLTILSSGSTGSLHLSFYDSSDNLIAAQGVVVDSNDSLFDIKEKLNSIIGLRASLLSDLTNDGKLQLEVDTAASALSNVASFAISNNTGGYDTSGFLDFVGLNATAKSQNSALAAPTLTGSLTIDQIQQKLEVASSAIALSTDLNLSGSFTINVFETVTESTGKTDGIHIQQLVVNVSTDDSINDIMAKINARTTNWGISISVNSSSRLELTSTATTDTDGNFALPSTGTTNFTRLSFANTYQYPAVAADTSPTTYNGLADNMDFFATLQFNTFFSGANAIDIAVDAKISTPAKLNAAHKLAESNNGMALAMIDLQYSNVSSSGQFTLNETYENIIGEIGTGVQEATKLAENEQTLLDNFASERDNISGVNLDEELAQMILFQRVFESNARMFATFDQMVQELLKL
ncbi:flagellar hook-associated protein FlgK [Simkania negevensis]|uniref:Flagellar hook-associated protein 1 n=1 Tax=Simkania negevensis TaxID=83561 RepID=A0ABS3ARE9_9BACT|nr:flagellar hook-associated protein FlgK [Simkania negevensis]